MILPSRLSAATWLHMKVRANPIYAVVVVAVVVLVVVVAVVVAVVVNTVMVQVPIIAIRGTSIVWRFWKGAACRLVPSRMWYACCSVSGSSTSDRQ